MPHARKTGTAWDRRKEDYAYTRELDGPGWAWEFLRRNEDFRRDYRLNRAGIPVAIHHVSGATLYRPRRRFLAAQAWGLELFADPNKTALATDVFWLPHNCRHAVQCHCRPADGDASDAISLETLRGRHHVLVGPDNEHIVVSDAGCSASMVVGSGTMLFGKCIVSFVHKGLKTAQRHHETMRILAGMTTSSANNNRRNMHKDSKLLEYLIALDGRFASLSYRDIAIILYGRKTVETTWSDDTRGYKSKVIRACKNGFQLMDRGYLKLL